MNTLARCNLRILVGGLDWASVDKESVDLRPEHPNRLGHGFAVVDEVVFDVIVLVVPSAGLLFNSRLSLFIVQWQSERKKVHFVRQCTVPT